MKQQHIKYYFKPLLNIKGNFLYVSKLKNCTKYFRKLEMPIIMQ